MTSANRYSASWEGFWSTVSGASGEIFWDADPAHAAQQDLKLFHDHADSRLPLIDLGCGNGTQTRFLANHFARVIGTEISPAALDIARTKNAAANISYRILDVLCPDDAQSLHEEVGDANLYMRGVLHQLSPVDQATAIESIARLLGATGTLYLIELSSAAESYLTKLIKQNGQPLGLARVFQHGITPGRLDENDLAALFPPDRFSLLHTGNSYIHTVHTLPTGAVAQVPAFYAVLRKRIH
ncbi:MAG: class I SAM-dependent methyltransferase [Nitrospira sp. CG24E]|nr:MAG: class I SAM-dependent methyltransferase [Nitrospira sp. CG24E]